MSAPRILKTWRDWNEVCYAATGERIIDPDGFRDAPESRLYTEEEFIVRQRLCTLQRDLTQEDREGLKALGMAVERR